MPNSVLFLTATGIGCVCVPTSTLTNKRVDEESCSPQLVCRGRHCIRHHGSTVPLAQVLPVKFYGKPPHEVHCFENIQRNSVPAWPNVPAQTLAAVGGQHAVSDRCGFDRKRHNQPLVCPRPDAQDNSRLACSKLPVRRLVAKPVIPWLPMEARQRPDGVKLPPFAETGWSEAHSGTGRICSVAVSTKSISKAKEVSVEGYPTDRLRYCLPLAQQSTTPTGPLPIRVY